MFLSEFAPTRGQDRDPGPPHRLWPLLLLVSDNKCQNYKWKYVNIKFCVYFHTRVNRLSQDKSLTAFAALSIKFNMYNIMFGCYFSPETQIFDAMSVFFFTSPEMEEIRGE